MIKGGGDAIAAGFTGPAIRDLFIVVDRVEDVLPAINALPETRVTPRPDRT